ncbi:hypothetical protein ACQ4PT_050477 [Festuca glaucescens]
MSQGNEDQLPDPNETHKHNINDFLDCNNTVSHTPATRQSAVTQLQNMPCEDGDVTNSLHLHGVILEDKENVYDDDESNWLRRNDAYQRQQFSGRMRVAVISSGHNTQTSSSITVDNAQDFEAFVGSNILQLGGGGTNHDPSSTPINLASSCQVLGSTNHVQVPAVGNDQTDDAYGLFEPDVQQTILNDNDLIIEQAGNLAPRENHATDLPADPKEIKRQRDRERYALNRDDILSRQRQSRENKKAYAALKNDRTVVPHAPLAMSQGNEDQLPDPKERKRQRARERYSQNREDINKKRREAYQQKKTIAADNSGTHTPTDVSLDPNETHKHNINDFLDCNNTVSHTPATGQSAVTQLQNMPCADGDVTNSLHLHGVILEDKENVYDDDESNWLRRNDAYQRQQFSGRMRVVVISSGHNTQTSSSIIVDNAQDFEAFVGSNILQLGGGGTNHDPSSTPINLASSCQVLGSTNHVQVPAVGNDQTDDAYGLFEPDVQQTILNDNDLIIEQAGNLAPRENHATDLPADKNMTRETISNSAPHEDLATNLPADDDDDDPDEDFGDNEVNAKQSRKYVSAREYYCFKLQVRKKLFNIILFGGRLFQQWVVDMYIKIETMRLDWYSKPENQKVIHADLYQVNMLCLF